MKIPHWLWPTWKEADDTTRDSDLEKIEQAEWNDNTEAFLNEAIRLRELETERSNSSGTKSQIYIGALLALIPILLSIGQIDFFAQRLAEFSWSGAIAILALVIGSVHGLFALYYAMRVLNVGIHHRIDVIDLVNLSSSDSTINALIREILLTVRRDRAHVNRRVGFVKMTQSHIARMAIMFLVSVILLIAIPLGTDVISEGVRITCELVRAE